MKKLLHACLICLALITACAPTTTAGGGLIDRLKNRGPVALSEDNPYLAANLLVAREMERSPELAGFVKHRGPPAAIEVSKELFSALFLKFYYPASREYFTFERLEDVWIIRGPLQIPEETLKEVSWMTRRMTNQPQLAASQDDLSEYGQSVEHDAPNTRSEDRSPPLLNPAEPDPFIERLNKIEQARKSSSQGFSSPATTPPTAGNPVAGSAAPDDRLSALAAKSHPAELTPRGDLVHYVTYPGETLSMIARWYTRDRDNAARIARINQLKNPNRLGLGDSIIIPRYLLKNQNRITEEAVQVMTHIAEQERAY